MGEQCAQGDMDLTWQEIFSITELQGLDLHPDSPYDVENGYQAPTLPVPGGSFSSFQKDGILPSSTNNMPICNRYYMDCQAQNAVTISMTSGYGPTSYTGMLISSNLSQMGTINHYPLKQMAVSAPGDQVIMPEPYLGSAHSLHLPSKNHDDFESDSGLSLNFSDGESIEIEKRDSHSLRSEYMEIIPHHAYQNQYPLAPSFTQPVMENNMCETQAYFASRTQDLVCGRDERRAAAMQIPFPTDRIVNLPVEDFNELLSRHTLTESQLALVRDIRRRGKNKVAAQNCRKRKMENISILEKEIGQLRLEREGLHREREEVESIIYELKSNMKVLQQEVYSILKNQGNHHYPEDIFLHQTPNGNVSFSLV
ncbi:transcription factor NF-E2 45 kDa subunit [Hyla sarda]|uniref:transcription factor NF-E2 45 kDa subunit n=1 Tax=Hyla sarda TaxID=327740 RepID=UPI0024C28829|nr:transcription factor NF-E2 45 kDa subunit [Hyla sarda]XP_056416386.1 transcription factor NF-E2 45 kDa subunit [Hyla sarda]XP_056416387.1 transcription factor NF-E2 45 kDa subunit [Hyla sarda]